MIHLTQSERDKFKQILGIVMSEEELKQQFDKAVAARRVEPGDHQSAVLGLYANLIDELQEERTEKQARIRTNVAPGPDLEALKKKFLGPGK